MPTRIRADEREFPQEETVALGQFCGESIGSLRVLPSCHSSPLRDAPRGSVGAAIGGGFMPCPSTATGERAPLAAAWTLWKRYASTKTTTDRWCPNSPQS